MKLLANSPHRGSPALSAPCLLAACLLALAGSLPGASSACAQQRPGLVSAGDYEDGTLGSQQQPARMPVQPGSTYRVGKWPTYTSELAPGKGRDTVLGNCSMCHSTTYITMQPPLPAATWQAEVHKMIAVMGAPIQPTTEQEIVAYLQAHYTPQTRKP